MKFNDLSKEFRTELTKAVRLSVFLSALVFGFLIFQNRTADHEELTADRKAKCRTVTRMPASEGGIDLENCRD